MSLSGQSFLGGQRGALGGAPIQALNPTTGERLEPVYSSVSSAEVNRAVELAAQAFPIYSRISGKAKGAFLRSIADGLDNIRQELAERAHLETALPMPRLLGEAGRTTGQLRLFASVVEEGSWVEARIDPPLPDRKPMPRVGLRSMLRPLGPVVVFGASNFPLAFSAAGGDTASALAAGCPVIVKAHSAHPGTSELVATVIQQAVAAAGLPEGVFSLLYGSGIETGAALVRHPLVHAVTFTGSLGAGRKLMDMAAARPRPIPCFTEMSSCNPVFILPGALSGDAAETLARNLFGSFTLGAGQFCTKPGIVFIPEQAETDAFLLKLCELVAQAQPFTLLTAGIARDYARSSAERATQATLAAAAPSTSSAHACPANAQLFTTTLSEFLSQPELSEEIFGPDTLIVRCPTPADFVGAAEALDGHLTATIAGTPEDLATAPELVHVLERKAGRLLFNGFPTGVEVSHAMVHGGPYPATSDSRFTSVGTQAIFRFARPVCFQDFPEALVPAELQAANPLGILRLIDGVSSREPLPE
jgi:NADP-dependent aldehyde dehydrogenase